MDIPAKKPMLLPALLTMKCPSCRRSSVFVNKSVFPLTKCLALKDECEVCGQKMKSESNNGGGINYALTMLLFMVNAAWYAPIFGLTFSNSSNSVVYYIITSTIIVLLAQPWLMRLSRMVYLYLYVGFGTTRRVYIED